MRVLPLELILAAVLAACGAAAQDSPCPAACEHGGRCVPPATSLVGELLAVVEQPSGWTCSCPPLWGGARCTVPLQGEGGRAGATPPEAEDEVEQGLRGAEELLEASGWEGASARVLRRRGLGGQATLQAARLPTMNIWRQPAARHLEAGLLPPFGGMAAALPSADTSSAVAVGNDTAKGFDTLSKARVLSAAELTGVKQVTRYEYLSTAILTAVTFLVVVISFSFLRRNYPMVYQGEMNGIEPESPSRLAVSPQDSGRFSWLSEAWNIQVDEIIFECGLDSGMFIAFLQLAMKILLYVGAPLFCILSPIHIFFGGNAAGDRKLSWFGIANVQPCSVSEDYLWIYILHAVLVWYVVYMTMRLMYTAMETDFVDRRSEYLRNAKFPKTHTILVEEIPKQYTTTDGVLRYFEEEVFASRVIAELWVVKSTSDLQLQLMAQAALQQTLDHAVMMQGKLHINSLAASPLLLMRQLEEMERRLQDLREEIRCNDSFNMRAAFITFRNRRDKIMACKVFSEDDLEEIVVSNAPNPNDIRWGDLMIPHDVAKARGLMGEFMLGLIFASFIPVVAFVQGTARLEDLSPSNPLYFIEHDYPELTVFWNGLAASVALSIVLALVPILFQGVIDTFFKIRSNTEVQLWLQHYYFCFLFVFVLLISAIGDSVIRATMQVINDPSSLARTVAAALPSFATFYLNYLLVQMTVDMLALLRFGPLGKYLFFLKVMSYTEEKAKEAAEPEDPVTQGFGIRSSRMMLLTTLSLLFVQIHPLVAVMAFLNFAWNRVVYAYLFMYAETTKSDLGGEFWISQLRQMQWVVFIYVCIMTGKLLEASGSRYVAGLAFSSLAWWLFCMRTYYRTFNLDNFLDFKNLKEQGAVAAEAAEDDKEAQDPKVDVGEDGLCCSPNYAYRQKELDYVELARGDGVKRRKPR